MAELRYSVIASADGFSADEHGRFDWAAPDEEVHAAVNDLERPISRYLYGRAMYDVMTYWEHPPEDASPVEADFATIWQAADKLVFSRTLTQPTTRRTVVRREFDAAEIAALKADGGADLSIGGPHLAAQALRAGLVDEVCLILVPVVVGGGTRALPLGLRRDLALLEQRRFGNGTVLLRYRIR